ncbi:hypothetical protein XENOCAPTIV_023065 [Xenoophorus captivus]|uniref:Uncharacterized protein n=1 Tax=Xenoophorus captivus TaxID=1517983 RepID=A0ABV0QCC6_9TELE
MSLLTQRATLYSFCVLILQSLSCSPVLSGTECNLTIKGAVNDSSFKQPVNLLDERRVPVRETDCECNSLIVWFCFFVLYDLQGGCLWRLVEALRRWSPLHQAAESHKLEQQLVGQDFWPVLGQMHPGPGCAVAGGRGAYRAVGPKYAHPRLVALRLPQPIELPAKTESRSQAVAMVFSF